MNPVLVWFTLHILLSGRLSAGLVRVYVQQVALQDEVNGHLINATDGLVRALLQEHNVHSKIVCRYIAFVSLCLISFRYI